MATQTVPRLVSLGAQYLCEGFCVGYLAETFIVFDMVGLCVCGYMHADEPEHMHGCTSICMAPTPPGQPLGRLAAKDLTTRVLGSPQVGDTIHAPSERPDLPECIYKKYQGKSPEHNHVSQTVFPVIADKTLSTR